MNIRTYYMIKRAEEIAAAAPAEAVENAAPALPPKVTPEELKQQVANGGNTGFNPAKPAGPPVEGQLTPAEAKMIALKRTLQSGANTVRNDANALYNKYGMGIKNVAQRLLNPPTVMTSNGPKKIDVNAGGNI